MVLKPLGDNIVVRQAAADETTKGGIILAEVSKEKPCIGTVISTGDGWLHSSGKWCDIPVKVGQQILYKRYGGFDIRFFGEEYTVLHSEDVIGLVVED